MIKINKSRGFTIIELIVVIVIIAGLAAIILTGLTAYVLKGRDAAARGDLSTALTNGTVYYNDITKGNNSYVNYVTGVGTGDPTYVRVYNALTSSSTGVVAGDIASFCETVACAVAPQKWCMSVKLKQFTPAKYFCVDSSGAKKESTTSICVLGGVCPD